MGLVASCVNIIQGLDAICTLARENIHRGESVRRELVTIIGKISSYRGVIVGIQLQAELEKATGCDDRLSALNHVDGPLKACEAAATLLKKRIETVPKRIHFGKIVDKPIAASLQAFDDALPVLQLALHADQR